MKPERSSGILMHITSLPGKYGTGTMGREAYEFVDLLETGGQKYWQTLPFTPVSPLFGYSPYSSFSSFAGNRFFINLPMIQKEEWMREDIVSHLTVKETGDFVDFDSVNAEQLPLLEKAARNFFQYAGDKTKEDYRQFQRDSQYWLEDYALFMAVAGYFDSFNWLAWDEDIRLRTPTAMEKWQEKLLEQTDFHRFIQYIFYRQWNALKEYANQKGIHVIGDIPIYVNFDSADAWAHTEIFQLDPKTRKPTQIAGVPPDYFSPTGQRWGNPLYNWFENERLNPKTTAWWVKRLEQMFATFDIVRLDHFRGFESYWAIPVEESTAINGQWEKGPGMDFFQVLQKELGKLPIIAEDLGHITKPVAELRDNLDLPGMKILQFAFDFDNKNAYLPHNYTTSNCIVYTGTHDNNTTNGWFYEEDIDEPTRNYVTDYLRLNHRDKFHWELIGLALSSIADISIFPVQDLLGYGGKFRMNIPGTAENNWLWKLTPQRLTKETMQKLKKLCIMYGRA
ncbi:MAG: 4-alpha-glucanotransferase [bacterium]|nr:4-alpha-glucanotransferase [bacterium]